MANVDVDDLRSEGPSNWREFLILTSGSLQTLKWVWAHFAGSEGRSRVKSMAVWMLPNTAFKLLPFLAIGRLVTAVQEQDTPVARVATIGFFLSLVLMELTGNRIRAHREKALAACAVQIDKRLSELFFHHGIGQFLSEGSRLSAANVEKARGRVWSVMDLMMFEGIAALMDIGLAYVLVWLLSPRSGLVMTGLFVIHAFFSVYMSGRVMRDGVPIDREYRAHNVYRTDRWSLFRRVIMAGRVREEIDYMTEWMARISRKDNGLWLWFNDQISIRGVVMSVFFSLCVWWEVTCAFQGILAVASMVPLFSWSYNLFMNFWRLGHMERQLNWNMPSVQAMVVALTIPTDVPVKADALQVLPNGPLGIELRDVSYAYPSETSPTELVPVLSHVNLVIPPGCKVGLVGETGSGKSTIGNLLLRFMDPTSGAILVNGYNLRDLDLSSYCRAIGDIPQHPEILEGTLRDNVLYNVPLADRAAFSDADVWSVLAKVQLADHKRFTNGLDTRLGKNGMKLSGGQRQRLAIASAIIQHLRFVVIDEATSALDAKTERRVQKGIEAMLGENTTALMIAHRLPTLRFCDMIVILRPASSLAPGESQIEYVATSLEDAYAHSPTFRGFADELGMAF
ncbi:hypothetical protein COV06_02575 [Candidatus Uhrbacteria bacterium CG10_big_fil_rev_8_21_14_0_10_50_16]|uniref:ABC transporter domain-containing protein n=1 Tax=Candidatus Uhrbacteria bacterium CG10_big_fil_rev_8_21_14_0_10_50_16 TaxID=1975039 RepID=A0A2H0RP50_9BACT|nr:MAG: hypothetical protein COV06_02575 [Candidatus Uhrbacteria bacterium CG10_big_fil_rev_8_21_14_0_10_50_16]